MEHHRTQRLLASVLHKISDGIVVADRDGSIVLVNEPARRFLGIETTDTPPDMWSSLRGIFRPDGATPFPPEEFPLARAARGEETEPVEMLVRNERIPNGLHVSVVGSPLRDEKGAVDGAIAVFRDIDESRREKETRQKSEERYRAMFEYSPLPMWIYDRETLAFVVVNEAAVRHYGYSREEFAAMTLADIRPAEDVPALRDDVARAARFDAGSLWRHRKKDGSIITVEIKAHEFEFGDRHVRLVLSNDVTERTRTEEALRKAEERLRHAQKMEAVGRLAGGVAHDFNNVLSVILSFADLVVDELEPAEPMRADVEQIRKAAERAADLTRQLLMFSRQQVIEPKVLDLNDVLLGMDKMLRRLLGADVHLAVSCARPLGRVRVDPGNIEQVIMNLVVNARDAMPTGGRITMETANVMLDEDMAEEHVGMKPGPHVMLAVTDTGVGMDRATQARIFEPFFTTKEKGKGTGLGLSTVFGIIQQSGGSIWVYSEPGKGSSFKMYLPQVDAQVDELRSLQRPATLRGSETVLLVEDDDQLRAAARGILRRHGYQVIEARNGGEAMLLCEHDPRRIDLLLSDVVMPQMSGPELARRLAVARPEMRVLCMSGYTDDSIIRHGVLQSKIAYLQKPITPETLTRKVRDVLEAER